MGCAIDLNVDEATQINGNASSFVQPPLLQLHGAEDLIVPYVNGKRVYGRAQAVGPPS